MREILSVFSLTDTNSSTGVLVIFLAGVGFAICARLKNILQGTTLQAALYWGIISISSITLCEMTIRLIDPVESTRWIAILRYTVSVTTFCPIVAVLGAKRPQHNAWQMIVFSLWVILAFPAIQTAFLPRGGQNLDLHPAWTCILCTLIFVGIINYFPTRFWSSGFLFGLGQYWLLSSFLPWGNHLQETAVMLIGFGTCIAALGISYLVFSRQKPANCPEDRIWLDFRDMFGVLWGLRIAHRLNEAATNYGWGLSLSWKGFCFHRSSTQQAENREQLERTIRSLLQRFVSTEWITKKLESDKDYNPSKAMKVSEQESLNT